MSEMPKNSTNSTNSIGEKIKGGVEKFRRSVFGAAAVLGALTLLMGLALALVNFATAPQIEKRLHEEKEGAIKGLFGGEVAFEYAGLDFAAPVREAVYVKNASSGRLLGYCVTVAPKGFSGEIVMLVAINANLTVKGVKILEMSETAGIGTRIESEGWFAEQFRHKSREISISSPYGRPGGNEVDTVAGATKSSKAFLEGVNAALEAAHRIRASDTPTTAETEDMDITDITEDIIDEFDE